MVTYGSPQRIISGSPNIPLPQAVRVRFACEADYKLAIATASTTSGAVKLNSPRLPFRPGGSTAFGSYTFLGPSTESTLQPTGWSTLVSSPIYQFFKVVHSRLFVRLNGANSGNNVVCTVFPAYDTTSVASIYSARTMPYAKQATFSVSKPNAGVNREGWMVNNCDPYLYYGTNPVESKADTYAIGSGSYNLDPAINLWWHIYLQSNDLDVSATTASLLQVRVEYEVELYGLQFLPTT